MATAAAFARTIFAAMLVLILAVRLLTPAGFMPAFDHGAVTIVVCPDAGSGVTALVAVGAHHYHHGDHSKTAHQPCPYASASGLGSLAADFTSLLDVLLIGLALLLGRTFLFLERSRAHERPPLRGPPFPA